MQYLVSSSGCAPPPLVGFVRARQSFTTLHSSKILVSQLGNVLCCFCVIDANTLLCVSVSSLVKVCMCISAYSLIPRPSCSVEGGSGNETIVHTAVLRVKNGESLCVVINIRSVRYTEGRHIGALAYKTS